MLFGGIQHLRGRAGNLNRRLLQILEQLAKLIGHVVRRVGEHAELVVALDGYAVREIAGRHRLRNGTSDMMGRENCVAQYNDPAAASEPSTIDSTTIVHSRLPSGANATSVRINRIVRHVSGRYGRFSVVAYPTR